MRYINLTELQNFIGSNNAQLEFLGNSAESIILKQLDWTFIPAKEVTVQSVDALITLPDQYLSEITYLYLNGTELDISGLTYNLVNGTINVDIDSTYLIRYLITKEVSVASVDLLITLPDQDITEITYLAKDGVKIKNYTFDLINGTIKVTEDGTYTVRYTLTKEVSIDSINGLITLPDQNITELKYVYRQGIELDIEDFTYNLTDGTIIVNIDGIYTVRYIPTIEFKEIHTINSRYFNPKHYPIKYVISVMDTIRNVELVDFDIIDEQVLAFYAHIPQPVRLEVIYRSGIGLKEDIKYAIMITVKSWFRNYQENLNNVSSYAIGDERVTFSKDLRSLPMEAREIINEYQNKRVTWYGSIL